MAVSGTSSTSPRLLQVQVGFLRKRSKLSGIPLDSAAGGGREAGGRGRSWAGRQAQGSAPPTPLGAQVWMAPENCLS